jgi:ketosteroid isomerase-like protein
MRLTALFCGLAIACAALPQAFAQSLGQTAPPWAREALQGDLSAVSGGRASLAGLPLEAAVRVTLVPRDGGVARVIRFEVDDGKATIALRRFTGHPQQGWWMWGPDTPAYLDLTEAQRDEIIALSQTAIRFGRTGLAGSDDTTNCPSGEAAFVEIAQGAGSPFTAGRGCVQGDGVSLLALRLSALAGSRDEGELIEAAQAELMQVDRAFAEASEKDGAQAAFQAFAREDALLFNPGQRPFEGAAGIDARFSEWHPDARLFWVPRGARVSTRGDMGWTWGEGLYISDTGERLTSWYVSVWGRDIDGVWKWVADIGQRGPRSPSPDLELRAQNAQP